MAGAPASLPPSGPPETETDSRVPLPHCPPNPAAAIAAATMPKRKKQNQQQPPPPPLQPPLSEREETGEEEDRGRLGPPSLLGPPPMANGKPGDPKSAPNWKPPTCPSSVEWINQLLCMYAMGYYTAMKMNQLLLATWMNLTNTMLAKEARHKRMQTLSTEVLQDQGDP
ncbi:proline-rich protein 3 isoform X2 [Ochotona curzoniae]|uniref:proline-rich protein 3 isoform X2 n=1 Tax=Ochotona curzoniae TaxID=130825 RepID=UPI001B346D6B|nr:proline-rich protein 3 isoform X2 [Ochotona curzoniae]